MTMPPLPLPDVLWPHRYHGDERAYSADAMHAYAEQAVAAAQLRELLAEPQGEPVQTGAGGLGSRALGQQSKRVPVFCKDCKHRDTRYEDLCNHPSNRDYDLITGEYILQSGCYFARRPDGTCGKEGRLYESL